MSGGGGKQRPSESELAQARIAVAKDQRFNAVFRPLEQAAIKELDTANAATRSAMLAGRQNSDLEQAAGQAAATGMQADTRAGTFGSGATQERGLRLAGATEQAKDATKVRADQTARDSIDQDTMNVIKTGQGVARSSQAAFSHSARLANSEAISKLQAAQIKDQARVNAIGTVASAGLAKGMHTYNRALGKQNSGALQGAYKTDTADLNGFEKWVRNRWGSEVAT